MFCEYLLSPDNARRLTAIAAQKALNEGGVAVLIVPGDLFTQKPTHHLPYRSMRMELVMPPHIEVGQVASTALYSNKAIFSGRMDEVVDLVRSNFWRR